MIDLDEHPEDGRLGVELLQTWEGENGRLPETWTATTGSGGRHLFFKLQGSMKRQQHLYDNQVDFQTDGALVILPPTIHAKTGRPYKWDIAPDQRPLAVYDDQAAAFIDEGYLEARAASAAHVSRPRRKSQPEAGRTTSSGCCPACRRKASPTQRSERPYRLKMTLYASHLCLIKSWSVKCSRRCSVLRRAPSPETAARSKPKARRR